MPPLNLYWIDFCQMTQELRERGLYFGAGVTAASEYEAIEYLESQVFISIKLPKLKIQQIESLDEIEKDHVRPNVGDHTRPGIWFPQGPYF